MTFLTFLALAFGLVLLLAGAELLVTGASRLAVAAGVAPLVVGLTVVAFGTSAPEFAVSAGAALGGSGEIALGNVVGSNIANVLLILGLAALVAPLRVELRLLRLELPLLALVSIAVLLLGLDGAIGRIEGALLFLGVLTYTFFVIRASRREGLTVQAEFAEAIPRVALHSPENAPSVASIDPQAVAQGLRRWLPLIGAAAMALSGLASLVFGAQLLVYGATDIARSLGLSELMIGLTIVAVGTSLPEVAASLLAARRGEGDLAVGNVIGSNLFNLLAVLGGAAALAPQGVPVPAAALWFDLPVMIAVALVCLPVFWTGMRVSRLEGALLAAAYVGYLAWLILQATAAV